MPSGSIHANTSVIKSTASSIRDDAGGYGTASNILFDTVNELSKTYVSEDGQQFVSKINSFRETFAAMQKKLDASAEALEAAAIAYEDTIKKSTV